MTLREFLRLMLRWWYVVLAAVLVVGAITVQFARDGGNYTSRTMIEFTMPGTGTLQPFNGSTNWSLITFAQTVATVVNDGRLDTKPYSHNEAPLYGAGLREAVVVGVVDEGSQWSSYITSATIEVQVVGRTREWVQREQDAAVDRVVAAASAEQESFSVPAGDRIAVHVEPLTRAIEHVTPSRTAQLAAAGAMLVVALLVGGSAAWILERRTTGRRSRRLGAQVSRVVEGRQAR